MRLWKKVPIGGATYRIYIASPDEVKRANDGKAVLAVGLLDDKKILLSREVPPDAFAGLVVHEIMHAVIYESHLKTAFQAKYKGFNEDEEEVMVKALEAILTPALSAVGLHIRKPRAL